MLIILFIHIPGGNYSDQTASPCEYHNKKTIGISFAKCSPPFSRDRMFGIAENVPHHLTQADLLTNYA